MAVRINLGAKALQHAAVSTVQERAGRFKPVHRRLCARAQFTVPPQRIGRLGRRQFYRRAAKPFHQCGNYTPPRADRSEARPHKITQTEAAHRCSGCFKPDAVSRVIFFVAFGERFACVLRQSFFIHEHRPRPAAFIIRSRPEIALLVQQRPLRHAGERAVRTHKAQEPRGFGRHAVVLRKAERIFVKHPFARGGKRFQCAAAPGGQYQRLLMRAAKNAGTVKCIQAVRAQRMRRKNDSGHPVAPLQKPGEIAFSPCDDRDRNRHAFSSFRPFCPWFNSIIGAGPHNATEWKNCWPRK